MVSTIPLFKYSGDPITEHTSPFRKWSGFQTPQYRKPELIPEARTFENRTLSSGFLMFAQTPDQNSTKKTFKLNHWVRYLKW